MLKNKKYIRTSKRLRSIGFATCLLSLALLTTKDIEATTPSFHIGTFEGSTTIVATSTNDIHPGLFIEVKDDYGNLTQYESEEGIITIPNTKEGAYLTQAKLLGKTKYKDTNTGEILDEWVEGRDLKLISVENPTITQVGGNLFPNLTEYDEISMKTEGADYELTENKMIWKSNSVYSPSLGYFFTLKPNTKYSFSYVAEKNPEFLVFSGHSITYHADRVLYAERSQNNNRIAFTFTTPSDGKITIRLANHNNAGTMASMKDCYLTETETNFSQTYHPKQTNTITFSDDLVLRSLPNDVRDSYDLMNKIKTKRVGEITLIGVENWIASGSDDDVDSKGYSRFTYDIKDRARTSDTNNLFHNNLMNEVRFSHMYTYGAHGLTGFYGSTVICVRPQNIKTLDEFKTFLSTNPLTIQYELAKSTQHPIRLTSTYSFKFINDQSVELNGSISSTIASITIPNTSLSFVLNPNTEKLEQFITPQFEIINDTLAPLQIQLETFEQTTDVLNDVLPTTYSDWETLNKTQSKDIALALTPIPSEGWLTLTEGHRFVSDKTNYDLGSIKAKSMVKFEFNALHGTAFETMINPTYRLTFVFNFLN